MSGSPRKSRAVPGLSERILSGSIRSASYNIIFQILTRVFTFGLNAFILRYIDHSILGICNVRLALLYSSIMFLSREPFRRACLRKKDSDSWKQTVNLIWFVIPNTIFWSVVFGFIWCYFLSQPGEPGSDLYLQYRWGVCVVCTGLVLDAVTEVPYIIGQYFLFYKLRIIGDATLIAVRSSFLCIAVVFFPTRAVSFYAYGSLTAALVVSAIYYGFFYYYLHILHCTGMHFTSVQQFLPDLKTFWQSPAELRGLVWSFYKQGILKQILTEGERYLMTFLDLLTFEEQGIYDLVSSLGSLAARFVFLPIEENAYFYFAKTLQRKCSFSNRDKVHANQSAEVLGILIRLMFMIGLIMLVYGVTFSNTVLHLYGGQHLSDNIVATNLLKANCIYIMFIALNGVLEAFTFAAMSQEQLDKFSRKLVINSVIFLICASVCGKLLGGIGFYLANSLNMCLRIAQSVLLIRDMFLGCEVDPFYQWRLHKCILLYFLTVFFCINTLEIIFELGRFSHVMLGAVLFIINIGIILQFDHLLFSFFNRMYKLKSI